MKANIPDVVERTIDSHLLGPDGKYLITTSPRCKAVFSDGKPCRLPCIRLNRGTSPNLYTDHCFRHGGHQEAEAYHRRAAAALMSQATQAASSEIANVLDLAPSGTDASNDSMATEHTELAPSSKPEGQAGFLSKETTSIPAPISVTGGGLEKVSPRKISSSNLATPSDKQDTMYTLPDATLRKSFQHKLTRGEMNLNEELAIIRMLIQQIVKKMSSDNLRAEELAKLDKLMTRADRILNTIHRIEDTRKVQYTRESLRMDVMKVLTVIKRIVPEEDRRRTMAVELAKILGPTLAESGDIIVTKETFTRG